MKIKITFVKDFATKKKGDIGEYDGMISASLIHRKIAKRYTKKVVKKDATD